MKKATPSRRKAQPQLETTSLRKGQEFTSKVWAKHRSEVLGKDGYSSVITRIPMGRSHFNHIECATAMKVATEPNNKTATLFLPLTGSMKITVNGKKFRAAKGCPMFLPVRTAMEFEATPIECLLIEVPQTLLLAELRGAGFPDEHLDPMDWVSRAADSLVRLLEFLSDDLLSAKEHPPANHLRRMEALLLSGLARAVALQAPAKTTPDRMIGTLRVEALRLWIEGRLTEELDLSGIAARTGVSPRTLQKEFLRHFHTTVTGYVRDRRLEAVRTALLGSSARAKVSEIACRHHFHHLGRFSQIYRKQFGELPTQTLARKNRA